MVEITDFTAALAIAFALSLIASIFMPSWFKRIGCFLIMFVIEFIFMIFVKDITVIIEIANLLCLTTIAFFLYTESKSFLKSFDIAFSILMWYLIFLHIISGIVIVLLYVFFPFGDTVMKFAAHLCNIPVALLLMIFKNKFFKQFNNVKLLKVHLLLKIFIFTILNFALPLLFAPDSLLTYIVAISIIILIACFSLVKYYSKLIEELENEKIEIAVTLAALTVKSELVEKQYDETIKIRHYYTGLFRSQLEYINARDMTGLTNYYHEHLAPINEQLGKEMNAYSQIKHIHIPLLKSRIIELINTISQRPNTKFILFLNTPINQINMADNDLFTIVNIYIDNALEETKTHETPVIEIIMTQNHEAFVFQIKNSLFGLKSEPKPDNPHRGLKIIDKILDGYPNALTNTNVKYGWFVQTIEVFNDEIPDKYMNWSIEKPMG